MSDQDAGYFVPPASGYPDAAARPDPAFPYLFTSQAEIPLVGLGGGVTFRPVFGRRVLFNYVYFDPNSVAPMHQHPEEQIGTMLEGEYEFEMDGQTRVIRPGDAYLVPPNVPHAARTGSKGCLALDIFSPPRAGFREMMDRVTATQTAPARGYPDATAPQDPHYFAPPTVTPSDPSFHPLFTSLAEIPYVPMTEGLRFRPLFGRNLLLNWVSFDEGSVAPVHAHSEEQLGTVISGAMEFEIAGERRVLRPGNVYVAPPYVPHGARAHGGPCLALDIFSPPRAGIKMLMERAAR